MSNAWQAATRPCSIDTDANAGGPVTSPAAKTPGAVVSNRSSTTMFRAQSTATPATSSPRSSELADATRRDDDLARIQRRPVTKSYDDPVRIPIATGRMTGIDDDLHSRLDEGLLQPATRSARP